MKRVLLAVVVLATAAGAAGWWWLHRAAGPDAWQGYVDAEYVRVSPTLTGRVTDIAVARGDQVSEGAQLFTQDDADDIGARNAAAGKLAEAQARLANLETRSRDTEIAQGKADLVDHVATRDRIASDLARNEELLRTGGPAARPWISSAPISPLPRHASRQRRRSSRRCSLRPGASMRLPPNAPWWRKRRPVWRRRSGA